MSKRKYLVAIFYIASEAQGSEISLAIEGWRRHFKEDHEIVVVGDEPPVKDVRWMYVERLKPKEGEYLPAIDICNKLAHVCYYAEEDFYEGFIWASDDFFAVNDFTIEDVMQPKYLEDELPREGASNTNHFWRTQVKTRRLLEKKGYGIVNWTTHLPMWFDNGDLYWLIHDYDLTRNSYIVENLYYNIYKPETIPAKLRRDDRWKFEVCFTPLDTEGFRNALANKIWVCCSVNGWSAELEQKLKEHYENERQNTVAPRKGQGEH